jgi:hypothetical protein
VGICFKKNNSRLWVFEIKNSKNCLSPVSLFLGDLKRIGQVQIFETQRGAVMRWGWGVRVCD